MIDQNLFKAMRSAYELFSDQLDRLIEELENLILELESSSGDDLKPLLEKNSKNFATKLHQIKGGAGFLKIQPVAESAAAGEVYWQERNFNSASRARALMKEICAVLKEGSAAIHAELTKSE